MAVSCQSQQPSVFFFVSLEELLHMPQRSDGKTDVPLQTRLLRVIVSVVILTGVTIVVGYGGWIVLSVTASIANYDPRTKQGDLLRNRLAEWPDRNRDVMRSNGREPLPMTR